MNNKTDITTKPEKKNDFYEILNKIIHLKDEKVLIKNENHHQGFPTKKVQNHFFTDFEEGGVKDIIVIQPSSNVVIDSIAFVRNGVNFNDFKLVYDLIDLSNNKWAEIIGISERTMQHILKEKKNLDQNKSEKLMAFLSLVGYALDVLGDHNNLIEWLNYKSPILSGKTPLDYVDTFQGINMLREQLFKIESGNLV